MKRTTAVLPVMSVVVFGLMLLYAQAALDGARAGVAVLMNSVMPALLPVFALTNIIANSSLVHSCGRALSPLMRRLFRLPGASGLAVVLTALSGYPNGARITASLFEQGLLTKAQAQATVVLSSTASPAFVMSVVAGAMLGMPSLGVWLFVCHLFSALIVGFLCSRRLPKLAAPARGQTKKPPSPVRTSFAQQFVDGVKDCALSLWGVGSFIIFFYTLVAVLKACGALTVLAWPLERLFSLFSLPSGFATAFVTGLFEMTNGCASLCATAASAVLKAPLLCALLSFGGLSVMAQIHLFSSRCECKATTLIAYKCLQAVVAGLLCYALMQLLPFTAQAYQPFATPLVPPLYNLTMVGMGLLAIMAASAVLTALSFLFRRHNRAVKQRVI